MAFGEVVGGLRGERRRGSLLADPARLEMLDAATLEGLVGEACGPAEPGCGLEPTALLDLAALNREIARRTGSRARLTAADAGVDAAARNAGPERRLYAAARLSAALNALVASDLHDEPGLDRLAETALDDAETALECTPGRLDGPGLVRARLNARRALGRLDRDDILAAAARFEDAALALEARVRATGAGEPEWAAALCERADLLIGFASVRKDMGLLDRTAREMSRLSSRLDPTRLPLSWMRAQTLQGHALRALGETTGEACLLKDAAMAFSAAFDAVPAGHSPLDRARAAHGLGLALLGLAEAMNEPQVHASAKKAFERALAETGAAASPLRTAIAHDRACALVRRAERSGDARHLAQAEAEFRADLSRRPAKDDPVGWAVVQLALARLYLARARLTGDRDARADAGLALAEALEVFGEHGQHGLADLARNALDTLRRE